MKKKLTQPVKFKRAIRELISYIDAEDGINDFEEWSEQVEQLRIKVNPKDRKRFDDAAEQLKIMAEVVSEAYIYLSDQLCELHDYPKKFK